MRLTTDFDRLSFHDASIEKIERSMGVIRISVVGAVVGKTHPKSNGRDLFVDDGVLWLLKVSGEEATYWDDAKQPKPHPNPALPLDEIMSARFSGSEFSFKGFLQTEPWFEWFVKSTEFEFEVIENHEINR